MATQINLSKAAKAKKALLNRNTNTKTGKKTATSKLKRSKTTKQTQESPYRRSVMVMYIDVHTLNTEEAIAYVDGVKERIMQAFTETEKNDFITMFVPTRGITKIEIL